MEKILLRVLDETLGKYLHGLNKQNLEVGVWKGEVNLKNIELRQDALAELELPVHVYRGHVSLISLSIPWNKLTSQPVIVTIKDIYLLALPTDTSQWSTTEFDDFIYRVKKLQISKLDQYKSSQLETNLQSPEDKAKSDEKSGWIEKLVTKIIANLQVTVENIHFRYEHIPSKVGNKNPDTKGRNPISFGITLKSLRAYSTNSQWQPTFNESLGLSFKIAKIEGLSIYGSNDTPSMTTLQAKEFEAAMKNFTAPKDEDYLFAPTNACLKAKLVLDPANAPAQTEVINDLDFSLDTVALTINQPNYQNVLRIANYMSDFGTQHKNFLESRRLHRAIEAANGDKKKIAIERWRFAIGCTRKRFLKKGNWDLAEVTKTLQLRNNYVDTFLQYLEQKKKKGADPKELESALETLELELSVDSVVSYRYLARLKMIQKERLQQAKNEKKKGIWSWFSDATSSSSDTAKTEYIDTMSLSEDEKDALIELARSMASNPDDLEKISKMAKMVIRAHLNKVSVAVFDEGKVACQILVEGPRFYMETRMKDELVIGLGVSDIRVIDYKSPQRYLTLDEEFKDGVVLMKEVTQSLTLPTIMVIGNPTFLEQCAFRVFYQQLPEIHNPQLPQSSLKIYSTPLEILCPQPPLVKSLTKLFDTSVIEKEEVNSVLESVAEVYEFAVDEAGKTLERSIKTQQKVYMDIVIQVHAPRIIIPSCYVQDENTTICYKKCVVLDLGQIQLKTLPLEFDPVTKLPIDTETYNLIFSNLKIGIGDIKSTSKDPCEYILHPFEAQIETKRTVGVTAPMNSPQWQVNLSLATTTHGFYLTVSPTKTNILLGSLAYLLTLAQAEEKVKEKIDRENKKSISSSAGVEISTTEKLAIGLSAIQKQRQLSQEADLEKMRKLQEDEEEQKKKAKENKGKKDEDEKIDSELRKDIIARKSRIISRPFLNATVSLDLLCLVMQADDNQTELWSFAMTKTSFGCDIQADFSVDASLHLYSLSGFGYDKQNKFSFIQSHPHPATTGLAAHIESATNFLDLDFSLNKDLSFNLDAKIQSLYLNWRPTFISSLVKLVNESINWKMLNNNSGTTTSTQIESSSSHVRKTSQASSSAAAEIPEELIKPTPKLDSTIKVSLNKLSLILHQPDATSENVGGDILVEIQTVGVGASIIITPDSSMQVEARLGNALLLEPFVTNQSKRIHESDGVKMHEVFGCKSAETPSVLTVSYQSFNPDSKDFPGYGACLKVNVEEIYVCYVQWVIFGLLRVIHTFGVVLNIRR